eukprot:6278228-Prymnesium_polylepis.1
MISDPVVHKIAAILEASPADEAGATGAPVEDEIETVAKRIPTSNAAEVVWKACCEITGEELAFDVDANLFDIGVDSLGMAELVIQLEETLGEGAITVDDIVANPVV